MGGSDIWTKIQVGWVRTFRWRFMLTVMSSEAVYFISNQCVYPLLSITHFPMNVCWHWDGDISITQRPVACGRWKRLWNVALFGSFHHEKWYAFCQVKLCFQEIFMRTLQLLLVMLAVFEASYDLQQDILSHPHGTHLTCLMAFCRITKATQFWLFVIGCYNWFLLPFLMLVSVFVICL